jgi:hypothetical protein
MNSPSLHGAARRAALVASLNFLPVVVTIFIDHLKDIYIHMNLIPSI